MFHSEFTHRANLIAAMRAHQLRLFDATPHIGLSIDSHAPTCSYTRPRDDNNAGVRRIRRILLTILINSTIHERNAPRNDSPRLARGPAAIIHPRASYLMSSRPSSLSPKWNHAGRQGEERMVESIQVQLAKIEIERSGGNHRCF